MLQSTRPRVGQASATPAVIAHRGASGYRPENTLAAFELAARMGADRLEPDVVPTRDGVLVLRHESELTRSTDVAERRELAGRRATRRVDGRPVTGWFTEDLTLEELRSLRAVEPQAQLRQGTTVYDGLYPVPTFAELLALADRLREELGRPLVVSAEVKEPSRYRAEGLDVARLLLAQLDAAGVADDASPAAPVAVQCFEPGFLRRLRAEGLRVPLVQLVDADLPECARLCTPWGLREVSTYAQVLAPAKEMVLPLTPDGRFGRPTGLVEEAHRAGLAVHVWTLRNENAHLPAVLQVGAAPGGHGRAVEEHLAFLGAGVDGIFTDHPDTGHEARRLWLERVDGRGAVPHQAGPPPR
ncbi:glycerophosphodiester phosphodiesterase family protein [Quadrisphaera sp. DSM 44207]|uniref:glycerophosphodiester phosphodiesterase family protein n=1 Tax=Quadrisphaera sp. DSM 44207 TaxID=1881057 RepID=UPI0008857295|nr:glycerophosphodiester phosphodiesterase family protein [Quadrisphaera sp. DSM 44207]SDQ12937.1 glycerophosphoryl diester phosphodiesterase [Quadrisphaera sp. DSM 44207]